MTLLDMVERVGQLLSRGNQMVPDVQITVAALNDRKNWLYSVLEARGGRDLFMLSASVSVAQGDASFNLPTSASRIIEIKQTLPENTCDKWRVIDVRDVEEWRDAGEPTVYLQGTTAVFADDDGAPYAATVQVSYTTPPPSLTYTPGSAQTYSYFPAEYHDVLTFGAASDLGEPGSEFSLSLFSRMRERQGDIERAAARRNVTEPMRIKRKYQPWRRCGRRS